MKRPPSLFGFYNRTVTIGGQERLYKIFRTPISDIEFLETRKKEIEFFCSDINHLKLNKRQLDYVEYYLSNQRAPLKDNFIDATKDGLANRLNLSEDYYTIIQGLFNIIGVLINLRNFLNDHHNSHIPNSLTNSINSASDFLNLKAISEVIRNPPKRSNDLKFKIINKLDYLFRVKKVGELKGVLDTIYEIDVLQSLSILIRKEGLTLAEYSREEKSIFEIEKCFHPLLKRPQPNNFIFNINRPLCFLTGPNMSGKSTFLKTIAILVYFSHLGLPVPAKKFKTTPFNGLFTTINISDNINQGLSHFYAEVQRVKEMSLEIQKHKNLVVILDELFKGTNVKDAFDATLMVVKSLSRIKGTIFFISSHILEVAETLETSNNINFNCFESSLKNHVPEYDFKLKQGVSRERIGLQIIKNENIENILTSIIKSQEQ